MIGDNSFNLQGFDFFCKMRPWIPSLFLLLQVIKVITITCDKPNWKCFLYKLRSCTLQKSCGHITERSKPFTNISYVEIWKLNLSPRIGKDLTHTHTYMLFIVGDFWYSAMKLVTALKTVGVVLIDYREKVQHSDFEISNMLKSHEKTSTSKISNTLKGDPETTFWEKIKGTFKLTLFC